RAQYPQMVGEQLFVRGGGPGQIPSMFLASGKVVAGSQGVGVVGAKPMVCGGMKVLPVAGRGRDELDVAEAAAGAEQYRVGGGLPEMVAGMLLQGGGVGSQRLPHGAVALDVRPRLEQGVRGGLNKDGGLLGGEGV